MSQERMAKEGTGLKAAVFEGTGNIQIKDIAQPQIGPQDVLLKVKAVGICGSDLHTYRSGLYAFPGQIMGHEFCAEVVEIGPAVTGIGLGQRATGFSASFCGECYWCRHRQFRLCPHLFETYTGYGRAGAMAEYVKIENAVVGENLFVIPPTLSDEEGATAEPLGTALYAVARTKPSGDDVAIVIGAGMIGNLIIQVLKTIPVKQIIASEVSASRSEWARSAGADVVINPRETDDLLAAVQSVTGIGLHHFGKGGMADIVYDTAGARETFNDSLGFVRSGGTVALVGLPERPSEVNVSRIILKDIRVMGVLGSMIPRGLEYLERHAVHTSHLVTHRFSLRDADRAFKTLIEEPQAMRVMLFPD